MDQMATGSRGGRERENSGSTTSADTTGRVQPVERIGVMRTISTLSESPGDAPSIAIGPFIGFGAPASLTPPLS